MSRTAYNILLPPFKLLLTSKLISPIPTALFPDPDDFTAGFMLLRYNLTTLIAALSIFILLSKSESV